MKKIRISLCCAYIILLFSSVALANPPADVVEKSIVDMVAAQYNLQNAPPEIFIFEDFEITNTYTKVVDNETGYLYEFQMNLKVRAWDGEKFLEDQIHDYGAITGTVALVKRGSKWYSVQ